MVVKAFAMRISSRAFSGEQLHGEVCLTGMDGLSARKHVIPSSILKSWSQRAVSVDVSSKSCNQAVMGKCMGPKKAMARRDARRFLEASIGHLEAVRLVVERPLPDTKVLHRPDSLHLIFVSLKQIHGHRK